MNNPRILLKTELGNILLELYQAQAPITVANFLRYVDENRFADACFYRAVHLDNQPSNEIKIEVIQGGLRMILHSQALPAIIHETTQKTGILHYDGTISMARNEPGTASSEFFICINDQPELNYGGRRNPDGQGFAAFGKVAEGIDIVRKIQSQPVERQYLIAEIRVNATRSP